MTNVATKQVPTEAGIVILNSSLDFHITRVCLTSLGIPATVDSEGKILVDNPDDMVTGILHRIVRAFAQLPALHYVRYEPELNDEGNISIGIQITNLIAQAIKVAVTNFPRLKVTEQGDVFFIPVTTYGLRCITSEFLSELELAGIEYTKCDPTPS